MPPKTSRKRTASGARATAGISEHLRQIILARRLSSHAVAESAGVAPSVVSRFLGRERSLGLGTFDAIAGALGLRLVESARGRGRTSKSRGHGTPPVPASPGACHPGDELLGPDEVEWDAPGDGPAGVDPPADRGWPEPMPSDTGPASRLDGASAADEVVVAGW